MPRLRLFLPLALAIVLIAGLTGSPAEKPSSDPNTQSKSEAADPKNGPSGDLERDEKYRSEWAYRVALEQGSASKAVTSILGTRIKPGAVLGKRKEHKGSHDVVQKIGVSGPKRTGKLHVFEYNDEDISIHNLSVRFVSADGRETKKQEQIARNEAAEKEQARAAEADRAEGERLAKLDAQAQKVAAEQAAAKEKAANQQAQKRLTQIEKANDILGSIFENLDPKEIAKAERPLQAILVEKLDKAVAQLEGESIGDPLVVAAMQEKFGNSLFGLGEPGKASAAPKEMDGRRTALPRVPGHPREEAVRRLVNLQHQVDARRGALGPEEVRRR